MKLKVGDIVVFKRPDYPPSRRRILEVRPTGYEWEYAEIPGKTFMSENSNDPFFDWWEKENEPS